MIVIWQYGGAGGLSWSLGLGGRRVWDPVYWQETGSRLSTLTPYCLITGGT